MDNVVASSVQKKNRTDYWTNTIFRIAAQYDAIPKWWSPRRDAWFRDYWPQENFLASAIYGIASRNAAFGWELSGTQAGVKRAQQLLQFADFGAGYQSLITKITTVMVALFMLTSLGLAVLESYRSTSMEKEFIHTEPKVSELSEGKDETGKNNVKEQEDQETKSE